MELTLKPEEAAMLRALLETHLSDLKMEISNTDKYELREALKREEVMVKSLIDRLGRLRRAA